jgi:methyltransferase (TIGR00027 family)
MEPDRASMTALGVAYLRAWHFTDQHPHVFADSVAPALIQPSEQAIFEGVFAQFMAAVYPEFAAASSEALLSEALLRYPGMSIVLARARHCEDRLQKAIERGVSQYVVIGAGLDTFAERNPGLRDRVQVFELDHPNTQAFKRERLEESGFPAPDNVFFAAADFERETVADALSRTPFDASAPAHFSWHGVTYYLTEEAIEDALRSVRSVASSGSELMFDYAETAGFQNQSPDVKNMLDTVAGWGEPWLSSFEPSLLPSRCSDLGFELIEDLGREDQARRYFEGRSDGLRPGDIVHSAAVRAV